jgi:hypothetical protein
MAPKDKIFHNAFSKNNTLLLLEKQINASMTPTINIDNSLYG